jgi:hypothetical protein
MTVSGQFSCPPPGSYMAASGQFLVAAVNGMITALGRGDSRFLLLGSEFVSSASRSRATERFLDGG